MPPGRPWEAEQDEEGQARGEEGRGAGGRRRHRRHRRRQRPIHQRPPSMLLLRLPQDADEGQPGLEDDAEQYSRCEHVHPDPLVESAALASVALPPSDQRELQRLQALVTRGSVS